MRRLAWTSFFFFMCSVSCRVHALDTLLENFRDWNEVPTEVYLGLLSNSLTINATSLINGTCFQYDVREFSRCKYYSDCCAMTPSRPLEQLHSRTFSCHDGHYIVDRCPPVVRHETLRKLCEEEPEGEISGKVTREG